MKNTYQVNLDPAPDEVMDYEVADRNLGNIQIRVLGEDGPLKGEGYRVHLQLSPDAMIGFGSALIRKGMASRGIGTDPRPDYEPIEPIYDGLRFLGIGMFLVPGSAQLQIFDGDLGTVDAAVQESIKRIEKK